MPSTKPHGRAATHSSGSRSGKKRTVSSGKDTKLSRTASTSAAATTAAAPSASHSSNGSTALKSSAANGKRGKPAPPGGHSKSGGNRKQGNGQSRTPAAALTVPTTHKRSSSSPHESTAGKASSPFQQAKGGRPYIAFFDEEDNDDGSGSRLSVTAQLTTPTSSPEGGHAAQQQQQQEDREALTSVQKDTEQVPSPDNDGGAASVLPLPNSNVNERRRESHSDSSVDSPGSLAGRTHTGLPTEAVAAHASSALGKEAEVHAILDGMSKRASEHVRRPRSMGGSAAGADARRTRDAPPATREGVMREFASIQRACGFGLNEEEEVQLRAAECGVPLHGPWMAAAASSSPAAADSNRSRQPSAFPQHTFQSFSAAIVLRVIGYCDLPSLAQLSRTNARLHVLSQHEGLWVAQAVSLGIDTSRMDINPAAALSAASPLDVSRMHGNGVGGVAAIRDAIQSHLRARKASDNAEVLRCEHELDALEQRMAARTRDNYKQVIDVDRTLMTHNPNAILNGTFTEKVESRLRQMRGNDGGGAQALSASAEAERYRAMLQQLRGLEAARAGMLAAIEANTKLLAEQQAALSELEHRTGALLRVGAAPAADGPAQATADVVGRTFVGFGDLCAYEKRIARLVINGGYNSNTAVERRLAEEVPLVLRRGVSDFGMLELLLRQLSCSTSSALSPAAPAALPPSHVKEAILARWAAFQRFCPLTDDYYLVRQLLQDREAGLPCDREGSLSKRMETALLRLSGIVRKVAAMKDSEVLDVVM